MAQDLATSDGLTVDQGLFLTLLICCVPLNLFESCFLKFVYLVTYLATVETFMKPKSKKKF
jgi:hypothetical protein